MTKLEQVARALSEKALERHQILLGDQAMTLARAAVEALREPTAEMLQSGAVFNPSGKDPLGLAAYSKAKDAAKTSWHAMIDAILSEKPE